MNSLVFIQNQEPLTTSLAIAEGTENQHKNVMELIRNYDDDLIDFGEVAFQTRLNQQGSPTEYALLNEQQATLLITYMRNSDVVRQFKKALVRAFFEMRNRLLEDSGDYKKVDVTMRHTRGITNPNGLDIRYTLDLTKICMNPNPRGVQLLERLTGIDMSDINAAGAEATNGSARLPAILQQFITDWHRGEVFNLPFCPCQTSQLYTVFTSYCEEQGILYPINHRQFITGIRLITGWNVTEVSTTNPLTGERFTRKMTLPPENMLADSKYSQRNWMVRGVWLFACHEAFSMAYYRPDGVARI